MSSSPATDASAAAAAAQPPASNKDWLAEVATQLEAEAGNLPADLQSVKSALASSAKQLRTPEAQEVAKELDVKKQIKAVQERYGDVMKEEQTLKDKSAVVNAKYKRHKKERDRVQGITDGTSHVKLIGYDFKTYTAESMEHTNVYSEEEKQREAMRLDTLNAETAQLEEESKDTQKQLKEYRNTEAFLEAKAAYDEVKKLGPEVKAQLAIKVGTGALAQRAINTKAKAFEKQQNDFLKNSKLENAEKNASGLREENLALNAKVSTLESKYADLQARHEELVQSNQTSVGGGDPALKSKVEELEDEKKNFSKKLERIENKNKRLTIEYTMTVEAITALPDGAEIIKKLRVDMDATVNDADKSKEVLERASQAVAKKRKERSTNATGGGESSVARKRPAPGARSAPSA